MIEESTVNEAQKIADTQNSEAEIIPSSQDDEIEEDDELPPPEEENEALIVNTGNIIAIIAIGLLLIFLFVFIGLNISGKKKKTPENTELDKAGSKTVIEFKDRGNVDYSTTNTDTNITVEKNPEEVNTVLDNLPPELQLPVQGEVKQAPVASVGSSSSSYKLERPDTRNSKSPRKIEGLASLNFMQTTSNDYNTVSNILNGNYQGNRKLTKEEYIAQQMQQTQELQNMLYSSGYMNTGNGNNHYGTGNNRQTFFDATAADAGNGSYLSKTALWDGTIISGSLLTAINTDNPGIVIARVTENVYSSQDHTFLLIPEGSLLMATYNSSVSYGQDKVQVAWNLLIRPDNYRIQLGNMNGVTAQGISGYKGFVNNHPWETLKAFGMIAVYSLIQTEANQNITSEKNEYLKNIMTDVYAEGSKIGNRMIDRALDIKPSISIKEGTEIKLITNVPLELPPVQIPKPNQKYIRTR